MEEARCLNSDRILQNLSVLSQISVGGLRKTFFYEIIMTLFLYIESVSIIIPFRFFIGSILDIFYL